MLSQPSSLTSFLILSSHPSLLLASSILSWVFPYKNPVRNFPTSVCVMSRHLILLDFITRIIIGEKCKSWTSSSCSFLPSYLPPLRLQLLWFLFIYLKMLIFFTLFNSRSDLFSFFLSLFFRELSFDKLSLVFLRCCCNWPYGYHASTLKKKK